MAINPGNGVLNIINGTLKVSSIDVKQAGGFSTAINTVARNDVLLFDDQKSTTTFMPTAQGGYMSSTGVTRNTAAGSGYLELGTASDAGWVYWPLQLPNSWHAEFDIHVTATGGALAFSLFNTSEPNHTNHANNDGGYKIVFDNTNNQIVIYWEGSVHKTVSASLRSNDWQSVNINYFHGAISVSLAGKVVLTHEFTQNYQEFDSRYIGFSTTAGTSHKIRHLRIHNSDKWLYTKTSNASDITYVSGNVGIGSLSPTELLDVHGNVHIAKDLTVDGNIIVSGATTIIDSTNLAVEDPIIELAKGNAVDTIDSGFIVTRNTSNVAIAFRGDEEELALGYTQSGASSADVTPIANGGLDVRVYGNLFANNLTTTANVEAAYLKGDGSYLTGLVTDLQSVADNGNTCSNTIQLTNTDVGLKATGNVEANYFVGDGSKLTGLVTDLQSVADNGNTCSNTIQFTNATTAFIANSNVGIGTATPSADLHVAGYQYVNGPPTLTNAFDHSDAPLTLTHGTATSSTAINDPKALLHLTRSGTNNESYGARASFNLSRYENSSTHSRSRLDVGLADGTYAETTVMTLRADGKVGVGTTSPEQKLEVHGNILLGKNDVDSFIHGGASVAVSSDTDILIVSDSNDTSGAANTGDIIFGSGASINTNQNRDFTFAQAYPSNVPRNEHMRITGDGKVGIGASTPQYKLDVDGGTTEGDGDIMLRMMSGPAKVGKLIFGRTGTTDIRSHAIECKNNLGGADNYMKFLVHDGDNTSPYETRTEVMTLRGDGKVGIGTTSPLSNLDIYSNHASDPTYLRLVGQSSDQVGIILSESSPDQNIIMGYDGTGTGDENYFYIASGVSSWVQKGSGFNYVPSTGFVGIGLTSPAFIFDVDGVSRSRGVVVNSSFNNDTARPALSSGTTHPSYEIRSLGGNGNVGSTGADDGFLRLRAGGGTSTANVSYIDLSGYSVYSGNDMRRNIVFGTSGTERMRIKENGNVGIGTTDPSHNFEVYGSSASFNVDVSNSDGPIVGNQRASGDSLSLVSLGSVNICCDANDNSTDKTIDFRTNSYSNGGTLLMRINDNGTVHFGSDGLLHINSRTTTYGSETVALQTTIDGRALTDSNPGTHGSEDRNVLALQPDGGYVGIGTTGPDAKLHIIANDTNPNDHYTSLVIDHNCSGGGTNTGDFNHTGILIDLDSTATGGNTSNEHRIYGIRCDTRHSGDSDLCYGVYSYTRSDHASGTNTNLRAGDFTAIASGTGVNTNMYGLNTYCLKDGGSTGTTVNMFGVRSEVEVDAGTCTNAYAYQAHIDRDGGTVTTGYLYYGSYAGSVGSKYGVYITGETWNYFSGKVGIGMSPSEKLDVTGNIKCTGYVNSGTEVYAQNWFRSKGAGGIYWESTATGNGWHIYPKTRADMYFRTGSGSGGIAGTVGNTTVRGYVHWNTSNQIGFLNKDRAWALRMTTDKNCTIFGGLETGTDGKDWGSMTASYSGNIRKNFWIQSTYGGNTSSNYGWWLGTQNQTLSSSDNDLHFICLRNGSATHNGYIQDSSYNAHMNFTGQHRTFVKDTPTQQLQDKEGLIVSADQDEYIRMSGGIAHGSEAITINESLPVVSLSTKSNDKKCFGVLSTTEDPEGRQEVHGNFVSNFTKEKGDTRIYVNSVGEGAVWVTNINGNLESGDYITTSNVVGYGMKQDDDILHNYTVAKITMNCDFNPKTIPKKNIKKELANVDYWVEYATIEITEEEYEALPEDKRKRGDEENEDEDKYYKIYKKEIQIADPGDDKHVHEVHEELVNVLDEYGQLQWEDHPTDTEKAYKIRYLTSDGQITDESNAVHIAAFVGCTYHCG